MCDINNNLSQDQTLKLTIEQKIQELELEFQQNQGLILTENDLKCLLYRKLMDINSIPKKAPSADNNIFASAVHAEVSWYDKNNKLTIKPDITILEPDKLSILHKYGTKLRLPTKQCSYNGSAIIFELKFIRNKYGIQKKSFEGKNSIKSDFEKICQLFDRLDSQDASDMVFCYFVIFNKTDIKSNDFETFRENNHESYRHKIIYASGKVKFMKKRKGYV